MEPRSLRAVRAGDGHTLVLTWKNGAENPGDLREHLARFAVFDPIRSGTVLFSEISVGDYGWSVGWNDDMEISADTLWRLGLDQGASWLKAWRTERGPTQDAAATTLGLSNRMVRSYEAGRHLLPKTVRLACAGPAWNGRHSQISP